ncbi:histidine kinase [Bordetella genomosp. 5]|uniref:sensor histidine kinase n=1 Tax=Bordetella genomosp. 5 TaxID=1395608 RepID=UPI000B9EC2AC|nr:HAMP domain-containing sensor histidine kinase [Bordetella genomosp. 5]OZI38737.1 histidine kinase [Bordetella genomosp. 5]
MLRLPLTARIPLAVSLLFLLISAALTSLALHGLSRQFDRQITNLGQVYLDGLSAAILPAVRANDEAQMVDVLNRALDTHLGVVDRTLAVVSPAGRLVAHVARYPDVEPIPVERIATPAGTVVSLREDGVWTWRLLDAERPELGKLVANLDVADFLRQRTELGVELVLVGLAVSLLGALICYGMARRLQRPIISLTQALRAARKDRPRAMTAHTTDPELGELIAAYNWMAESASEREALSERHARIEREALLGRMSATLAHEVRNPLGGLRTAVQTLRQFGDRPQARAESLDFIERGVQALQGVVDASLRTFRPGDARLHEADIADVRLLVSAQAGKRGISVTVHCEGVEGDGLPLPAVSVRQLLLNLMLNAIEASPSGSQIFLFARARRDGLMLHVADAGPGLPVQARRALAGEQAEGDGIGLRVVFDLVRSMAGRLRVSRPALGTRISVRLPFDRSEPIA